MTSDEKELVTRLSSLFLISKLVVVNKVFFTPGPSQLYPTVADHMRVALEAGIFSISHRSKEFEAIFAETTDELKRLLGIPDSHSIFFAGSATEWMERILENCVQKTSFHFVNGAFSKRFFEIAQELKKEPHVLEVPAGQSFDFEQASIPSDTELICCTHNETSTGVALPMESIYALKERYPEALVVVDIVSSAPYVTIDWARIDAAFFSVQKGFGLPAGLGVIILNERCLARARQLESQGSPVGSYHRFSALTKYAAKRQTPETPNVPGIYLLGKVCADMNRLGIDSIRRDTETKARLMYDFFDRHAALHPFVKDLKARSNTVLAIDTAQPQAVKKALAESGFIVGSGYGAHKDSQIRIANFPAHSLEVAEQLLTKLKMCV